MLIRQSKNTFIRSTKRYGYITNQLTRYDRTYNATGADFLRHISREPKDVDAIVHELMEEYEEVTFDELKTDFIGFAKELEEAKFIIIADNIEELDRKDLSFTYSLDNPKTLAEDFFQPTRQKGLDSTQNFFLEEVQGRPLISNLQFELSSRCNERCIHCYIPNEKKNKGSDMPLAKVKSIINEFAEMGGLHVTLSGGEAFLHKDLLKICCYCREKDLKISILSNLISLKEEHIATLKEVNLSIIQTSLYSMNESIHDMITTVRGSFRKTKDAIERLVAADIPVQISCPVMKANRKGYKDVLEYAKSLKIKAQTDFIMMAQSDFNTHNLANRISIEETEELLRDIIEHDIDYHKALKEKPPVSDFIAIDRERYMKQPVCGVGYDNCCITVNGDVYPCAGWQNYVLGNVYKQPLKEIWEQSERVRELRKITQASFPQCLNCEARDYCARCLVRNFNESGGNMFAVNKHYCAVAFLTKRLVEEYYLKDLI